MQQDGKRSGGDPFVIALAMVKSGTVVTEEKPTGNIAKPRIPDVCDALGVHCLTLMEYIEAQGWTFSACAAAGDRTPVRQRAKNLPRQARTGWTRRHRPDKQTPLTWTYGTQQNTSPHCPAPWGLSGCGVPRITTSEPAAIQAGSVNASPNCELGAQPNSRELGNEFGNKTRRHCRDGVERDVMAWTRNPS